MRIRTSHLLILGAGALLLAPALFSSQQERKGGEYHKNVEQKSKQPAEKQPEQQPKQQPHQIQRPKPEEQKPASIEAQQKEKTQPRTQPQPQHKPLNQAYLNWLKKWEQIYTQEANEADRAYRKSKDDYHIYYYDELSMRLYGLANLFYDALRRHLNPQEFYKQLSIEQQKLGKISRSYEEKYRKYHKIHYRAQAQALMSVITDIGKRGHELWEWL